MWNRGKKRLAQIRIDASLSNSFPGLSGSVSPNTEACDSGGSGYIVIVLHGKRSIIALRTRRVYTFRFSQEKEITGFLK